MDSTLTNFDALKRSVDVHIHQFTNYGKAYMKKCDASPDAYAHRCHICTGAGLAAAASAPGLGEAAAEGTLLRPRDSCSLRWDRTCSAAPTAQRLAAGAQVCADGDRPRLLQAVRRLVPPPRDGPLSRPCTQADALASFAQWCIVAAAPLWAVCMACQVLLFATAVHRCTRGRSVTAGRRVCASTRARQPRSFR
jgi:hypothetical protein